MCDVTGPVKGRRPGRPAFFKAHATPRAANALPGPPTRHCSLAIQAEDCASGQIIVTHSNRNQCGLATHWVQQTGGWPSSGLTHGGDTLYTLYWIIARTGTRLLLSVSCALLRHLSGTLAVRCRDTCAYRQSYPLVVTLVLATNLPSGPDARTSIPLATST